MAAAGTHSPSARFSCLSLRSRKAEEQKATPEAGRVSGYSEFAIYPASAPGPGSPELIFRATLYPIEKVRSAQARYGCFSGVRSGVSVCARGWFLIGQPWGPSQWRFHFRSSVEFGLGPSHARSRLQASLPAPPTPDPRSQSAEFHGGKSARNSGLSLRTELRTCAWL